MVLYFGNMLSRHGKSPALMELVVPKLGESIEIKGFSNKKSQWGRLISMVSALLLYRNKCTLVIIDTFSTRAFWYCYILSLLCRLFKIPYLPVLHGGLFESRLRDTPKMSKQIFSNSAANISPSLFLKNVFESHHYKVIYIPNFLDLEQYPFKEREKQKPNLLWVRAFHKIYNPMMAVRVVKELVEKWPAVSLTMVGADKDGSLLEAKQLAKELGVKNNIKFTGYLSKTDWIALSSQSDFFINTTTADNMPVSVMEAMALGLVIISTNVGGIPFLLKNESDSFLVDNNDSYAMAQRINILLQDSSIGVQLAANARKHSEIFSWNHVGKQWLAAIAEFKRER